MRRSLLACIFFCLSLTAYAQTDNPPSQAEQLRTFVDDLKTGSEGTVVLLTDLTEISGYVIRSDTDWFTLTMDKKKRNDLKIMYADVLAISSEKASISFVPHPKTSPYGTWNDISKVPPNTVVEITLKNGEVKAGRYRSGTKDSLVLAHLEKPDEWTFARDNIAFVHRVKYGWKNVFGSMVSGTEKGARIGKKISSAMSKFRIGTIGPFFGTPQKIKRRKKLTAETAGAGIGAIAGATKGALNKHEELRVVIFSH